MLVVSSDVEGHLSSHIALFLAEELLEDEGTEGVGHGYLDSEADGYVEGGTEEEINLWIS